MRHKPQFLLLPFADIPSLINEIMVENADRIIEEYAGADSLEKCLTAAAQFALRNKNPCCTYINPPAASLWSFSL